jgi:hypothetical protein
MKGIRSSERGSKGEQAWHLHLATPHFYSYESVVAATSRYGFGRVNVKPDIPVGYAVKYVTKQGTEPGQRRWACFGGFEGVRVGDVQIYDQFKAYAAETRVTYPGKSEGAGPYWWLGCLEGLACSFMREQFPWQPKALFSTDEDDADVWAHLERVSEEIGKWLNREKDNFARVYPQIGVYCGRWVPVYRITDTRSGSVKEIRSAWHLVDVRGVPYWVQERGRRVPATLPAAIGERVVVLLRRAGAPEGQSPRAWQSVGTVVPLRTLHPLANPACPF